MREMAKKKLSGEKNTGQISIKVIEDDEIKKNNLHKKGKEGTKVAKKHRWINVFLSPEMNFFSKCFLSSKINCFFF